KSNVIGQLLDGLLAEGVGAVDTVGTIGTIVTVGTDGTVESVGTDGNVGTIGTVGTAGTVGTIGAVRFMAAEHACHLGRFTVALDHINIYISTVGANSDEANDGALVKARIQKRSGDMVGAHATLEAARQRDPSDRFVNTKTAKYALAAGLHDEAVSGYFPW
ncbi:unnamed protein product, partial [marine sediment metagenome]